MPNYDKKSVKSIYEYALRLTGKSLSEAVSLPKGIANQRNRGDLGTLVEKYYFEHEPKSSEGPDFAEAELELKTTGLLRNKDGKYKAKERLVLTMINYDLVAREEWENSYFLKKCKLMLILFYSFDKKVPVIDRKFVLNPLIYQMSTEDEIVIKKDWNTIRQKIVEGRAHEISEGDTFYLGACRKGSGGPHEALQSQPFSKELAKSRAFSFKQGYVNKLIEGSSSDEKGFAITNSIAFEEATELRFKPYLGMSIEEISLKLDYPRKNINQKGFYRQLAIRMMNRNGKSVNELEKAGIELKTIRLNEHGKPRESMSFPAFKTLELIEEDWDKSVFAERIEKKFLFVIFKPDKNGVERFSHAAYWNMPYEDRMEAKRVWEEAKKRASVNAKDMPRASESHVAHVRPKARDGNDKELTPQGEFVIKKCFWLNSGYIAKVIENL